MNWLAKRRQRMGGLNPVRARLKNFSARVTVLAFPVVGAALVAYGAWLIFPAAGFIVGGSLLVVLERRIETELTGGDA